MTHVEFVRQKLLLRRNRDIPDAGTGLIMRAVYQASAQ